MAYITGKKAIFFVTSPRSPIKMIDEIRLLTDNFTGRVWNPATQREFYTLLSSQNFFVGSPTGDIAFKARDRINRAPKSLGFVDLNPTIQLTAAGQLYLNGNRPEEIFFKQLLKFQFHSPFHIDTENTFGVKPYLELMRLIFELDGLNKIEIALFVMQLINYNDYNDIKQKILSFRTAISNRDRNISYKRFVAEKFDEVLTEQFEEEIENDDIETREAEDVSLENFITTKKRNHLDYADAAIRYLRATGIFTLNPRTSKIYVISERHDDLEFVLNSVERGLFQYENLAEFKAYFFNPNFPILLSDNRIALINKILAISNIRTREVLDGINIEGLKDIYQDVLNFRLNNLIQEEVLRLQTYEEYEDIKNVFSQIQSRELLEPPLILEWNTWRALTMLNDGSINGNFKTDDDGNPLYTAPGNIADIVCIYDDFEMLVEVTMASGNKQYEMEGEPVARHIGRHKLTTEKDVYCLFIAPTLSPATIAYYFTLYRLNIAYYGGQVKIIPITLNDFKVMLANANNAEVKPDSVAIKTFIVSIADLALTSQSESEWLEQTSIRARAAFI